LDRTFAEYEQTWDVRKSVRSTMDELRNLHIWRQWTGNAHPGTNVVDSARWTAEEADAGIDEVVEWHRQHGTGFQWLVGPWDSPDDLGARLERHGLLYAGEHSMMARVGLSELEIPVNADLSVVRIGVEDHELLEAALQITSVAFEWGPEQLEHQRIDASRRIREPERQQYVAMLNGEPVGAATLILRAGTVYLGGAATLPAHRNHRVYSTLLRKRLEAAHALGYEVAVIHAGPMSRRVVEKYGFESVGKFEVYGWMPVMDPTVIATLVQDD
ncbi:MAG TPA: GNAT family N-acetyltransferase, partial [Tepidiformaceae bacterium]|nr:GNAT family N-acetyltransferase [Tepidiformaceae bacterium]